MNYIGRFAPSPTGPLHFGSLVCAMASFLDARSHQGKWLLRIEDIDESRVVEGADRMIMYQLNSLGMYWDEKVIWQTDRKAIYQQYFDKYRNLMYGCICTRKQLHAGKKNSWGEYSYTNICRSHINMNLEARAWRLLWCDDIQEISYIDRYYGQQTQLIQEDVGDIIICRSDGLFSYQWVVVIDDALQGVTDIVRGADLLSSTPRQIALQQVLGFSTPTYLHVPLVLDSSGRKLSKQNHAPAIDLENPIQVLKKAFAQLGFSVSDSVCTIEQFWQEAIQIWSHARKKS